LPAHGSRRVAGQPPRFDAGSKSTTPIGDALRIGVLPGMPQLVTRIDDDLAAAVDDRRARMKSGGPTPRLRA
jgi:hypothetical protein